MDAASGLVERMGGVGLSVHDRCIYPVVPRYGWCPPTLGVATSGLRIRGNFAGLDQG